MKKNIKNNNGFTIIELIVVIAIIAVLAAIVLVNVTQYIAKGKNAAIKGNMSTIMTNAAVFYDGQSPSTYVGYDLGTTYTQPAASVVTNGGTMAKVVAASKACFCTTMNVTNTEVTGTTFCVDTSGLKVQKVQTCAAACVTPATGDCTP